jgi:hypothetical protein
MRTDDRLDEKVAVNSDLQPGSRERHDQRIGLGALQTEVLHELRSRWVAAYGVEPLPRLSRELLVRGISYRLQERARGGLSRKTLRRLEQIAAGLGNAGGGGSSSSLMRPGTRIVREWQGKAHEVIILEDGFLWNGSTYRSLSEIARLITGTRWSGPRFFGLKDDQEKGGRGKANG